VTIVLGKDQIAWNFLNACLRHFFVHLSTKVIDPLLLNQGISPFMDTFGQAQIHFDLMKIKEKDGSTTQVDEDGLGDGSPKFDPFWAASVVICGRTIRTIRGRTAMDDRDQVFGLHDLLKEVGLQLPEPDYNKRVPEVYEDFTRAMIQHCSSLWILHAGRNSPRDPPLPSWVPNLSKRGKNDDNDIWRILDPKIMIFQSMFKERAAWEALQQPRIPGQLRIRAVPLRPVTRIGATVPTATNGTPLHPEVFNERMRGLVVPEVAKWFHLAESLEGFPSRQVAADLLLGCLMNSIHISPATPELEVDTSAAWRRAFYRGLVFGWGPNGARQTANLTRQRKRQMTRQKVAESNILDDPREFGWRQMCMRKEFKRATETMLSFCEGLTMVVCDDDLIGLTDGDDIRPGDVPVLAMGALCVLYLRPRGAEFTLVGSGRIFGPGLRRPRMKTMDDVDLETLTLI
jgi:hypothetical protein